MGCGCERAKKSTQPWNQSDPELWHEGYYLALRCTQGTLRNDRPDWLGWITFFLRALRKQKRRLEERVEQKKLMRATMPALSVRILELITDQRSGSIGELARATASPLATVKKRAGELFTTGHLKRIGKGRATRCVMAELRRLEKSPRKAAAPEALWFSAARNLWQHQHAHARYPAGYRS